MAVGDLEGKIGELAGQLRTLAPILEGLGTKVGGMGEKLAAVQENPRGIDGAACLQEIVSHDRVTYTGEFG